MLCCADVPCVPLRLSKTVNPGEISRQISAARDAVRGGRLDEAASRAADILSVAPDETDALEIAAIVATERGEDQKAEQFLRRAIAVAPSKRWPYADLARLLLRLGRSADAEEVSRQALEADPSNPDAHALLGSILSERESWAEAVPHFRRAIQLTGRHPLLLTGLGRCELRLGHLDEALSQLVAAVAASPDALEPAVYLAEVHERLGQFEQAMAQLDLAEPLARKAGTDIDLQRAVLLARMKRHKEALALLDGRDDLSGAAQLQRGRLREQVGRYDEAWQDYVHGKATLAGKRGHSYDASQVEAQADTLGTFAEKLEAPQPGRSVDQNDEPMPLFIVGFPRSGTTLTEQILASHSAIRAGGELPFGSELREYASQLAGGEHRFPDGLLGIAGWQSKLREFYLRRATASGLTETGARYFTDKMPSNDMWLPLLRAAFPESPVILVRRHPLDVLTSVLAHDMTHGFHCAYRLKDAASHLALMDSLVAHYRFAGFGPTYELRYESLVADQLGETEKLMDAIGMPMEPSQLNFHQRRMVSPTPSYAQVEEPLNDRSIGRWRNFALQLEPAKRLVAQAMARGGYAG